MAARMAIGDRHAMPMLSHPRRKWLALGARMARLTLSRGNPTTNLVRRSYDRAANGYDEAWTHHMRDFSLDLLDRLAPPPMAHCLDLTCGTGFVTAELARRTNGHVVGVDSSSGMLNVARKNHGEQCTFIQSDAVAYLRSLPPNSVDIVTCAWGLGYSRPWRIVREAERILRHGGCLGIIDNTLFSLAEILWASCLAFAETPKALVHVMRVRFLPASWYLALLMRTAGFAVHHAWDGAKTYHVPDGETAIERLTATGAAAGFEFAADPKLHEAVFERFARIMEDKYRSADGIPITHRYLAATGFKP